MRHGPFLVLSAASALAAAACLTTPDNDILQFEEDFEGCDLCGWSLTGDARRVTTYHPGEHALALGVGATAKVDLGIMRSPDGTQWMSDDGNWVELSTDCSGPGILGAHPRGDGVYDIEVVLDEGGRGDFERHWLSFPPLPTDQPLRFATLTLATSSLPCTLDNLQLRISGGLYAF